MADPNYKRLEKNINNKKFVLDFYEFSQKNDKITSIISECDLIIIVLDLNNRNSFDNLADYWFNFLCKDCEYESGIYILGNYFNSSSPLTTSEEVNEMLKISRLNTNFVEIGDKNQFESVSLLDNLIFNVHLEELKNNKKCDGNKGHSLKVDKCCIY